MLQCLDDAVIGTGRNLQPFSELCDVVLMGSVYRDAVPAFHASRKARAGNDLHFMECILDVRRNFSLVDDLGIEIIRNLRNFEFAKKSPLMGDVKLTVTQLNCGTVHNVVPDKATFVVDIRPTEQYTNPEIMELLQKEVKSELKARNLNNKSSATQKGSILYNATLELGIEHFVSPTTSDWMKIEIPAIKIGPGESSRSHKADEFIKISEIESAIAGYINIIKHL